MIEEVDLSQSSFWIQLYGLPMASMNQSTISAIGSSVGRLLKIEKLLDGVNCKRFSVSRFVSMSTFPLGMVFRFLTLIYLTLLSVFFMRNCWISVTNFCVLMKFCWVLSNSMVFGFVQTRGIVLILLHLPGPFSLLFQGLLGLLFVMMSFGHLWQHLSLLLSISSQRIALYFVVLALIVAFSGFSSVFLCTSG